jgi:hypothetical protein
MKKLSTQLAFGILGIAGTLAISSFQFASAQTTSRDANVYGNTQSGDRPPTGTSMGTMFDLFHRAVLGVPRSSSEFGQEQQNSIGTEASGFRQRQQELLRQQQQGNTMTNPQASPTNPQASPRPVVTTPQNN